MTNTPSTSIQDRLLSLHIAALMRWGTGTASALLIGGVILSWADMPFTSIATGAGCAVFLLLPILRLVLMLISFGRRADMPYVAVTFLVITLLVGSAITGMIF